MRLRGGVNEVIPVLVLLALGVALTFALVSYLTTGWGHLNYRSTEVLRIGVDNGVTRCGSDVVLFIQFHNKGLHDIVVYKVEFIGFGEFETSGTRAGIGDSPPSNGSCNVTLAPVSGEGVILPYGRRGWVYIVVPSSVASRLPSTGWVDVKLYTTYGSFFLSHIPVYMP